ncbi:MAG: AsmA-like C-terminal region-containing protein, partial [Bacteroidales bacterium]|nr:AsmA-like C-terminal region-containing protein [Bacteroidales bacterium]
KSMNAKIDFDHLGLNFFKSFPNATVSLENFYIAGINEFEGDTLVFAKNLSATVNLKSLFGDTGYEITKISADQTKIHAIVLEDGKANWDIMKSEEEEVQQQETEEAGDFNLQLKKVTFNHTDILYEDRAGKMSANLKGLNVDLSGDMTADETTIKTNFTIDELSFIMDKIPYLSKAKTQAKIDLIANLKDMKFTFADNTLQINEIKANMDGWITMHEDESIEMDLKLNAPSTQFKDVLSMIPAIYAKDFKDLKTSGQATLDASVRGIMKGENLPAFDAKLNVSNAMFQYPGMPKSVTNIHANLRTHSKGGSMDNTIVDISKFHFEMGGNPFDLTLHVSNPMSDMNINLSAVGKLNLGMVKEIYPLEDMELSGNLDANMKLITRMSYIEKEQYDRVEASGSLNIQEMLIKSEDKDDIQIQNAHLAFSPRYVDLSDFAAQIGKNDIAAKGKLENFIPFFMKDETLKGNLTVSSDYLNLNDFMTEEESTTATTTDSVSIGVIEIPKNINFNLNGNFNHVIFDNLDMKNVVGQIIIQNGKVDLKNVSVNALGGQLNVNGYYDTGKDPKQPDVSMDLDIKNASFAETFSTFVTIQKLAPIFENMLGNYSTSFKMNSALGSDFMPILSSLTANGLLQSSNVEITNVPVLDGLASALKNESLKDLKVKDLKLPFTIDNGRVATKPFDINFGSGIMNLSGTTGLDQTIDYLAKIDLGDKLANNYLKSVTVQIAGTFTQPKFSIDTKDAAGQLLDNLASSLLGEDRTVGSVKEDLTGKAGEQIEKQIESIRSKAKETGDKLVNEADKQGQKLIEEANKTSNAIAKIAAVKAAEAGAKKMKEEAEKKAKELNEEAEKQIQSLKKE